MAGQGTETNEAERLIPYLYSLDARGASRRLTALGAAAVEPLMRVVSGAYPLPDLTKVEAIAVDGVLLACVGTEAAANADAARERAAYILGEIGDKRAVEGLTAAYGRETERHTKLAMARALGMIGDARAVDTLTAALETPAWTPHYRALVDDLARLGGEKAIEPLIRLVKRGGFSYGSAAQAARALMAHKSDARVLDGLIETLNSYSVGEQVVDAEFGTVEAVIAGAAEIGGKRSAQALLTLVKAMMALPAERWDGREENLSETEQGMIFHVLKTEFRDAVSAIKRIGDAESSAALEQALVDAPEYVRSE